MSAIVIATVAEKGGVGKTTLTAHQATLYGSLRYRVLVVDMDKQGDLTRFFLGTEKTASLGHLNSVAAIMDQRFDPEPSRVIHETDFRNVSIIPSHGEVLKQFVLPEPYWNRQHITALKDFIDEVSHSFDFVLIDTHPDLDTLPTWAALIAADFAYTPVEPEEWSAHSTVAAESRIHHAMRENPRLRFLGFVVNKFTVKRNLHREVVGELQDHHGDQVFRGALGNWAELPHVNRYCLSLEDYKPRSAAAGVIRGFAEQMITRMKESRGD